MKKMICICLLLVLCVVILSGCSKAPYIGTFSGKNPLGYDTTVTIKDDGTINYATKYSEVAGKWSKISDSQISASFYGHYYDAEPLIITVSADKNTITISSDYSGWTNEYFDRAK